MTTAMPFLAALTALGVSLASTVALAACVRFLL